MPYTMGNVMDGIGAGRHTGHAIPVCKHGIDRLQHWLCRAK